MDQKDLRKRKELLVISWDTMGLKIGMGFKRGPIADREEEILEIISLKPILRNSIISINSEMSNYGIRFINDESLPMQ